MADARVSGPGLPQRGGGGPRQEGGRSGRPGKLARRQGKHQSGRGRLVRCVLSSCEDVLIDFRERRRERGREHLCERETSMGYLQYTPRPGMEPTAWVRAPTGN